MGVIAAIQVAPIYGDAMATARRAAGRIAEAAQKGASSRALLARRGFDAVGHYGRTDIFELSIRGEVLSLTGDEALPKDENR